MHISSIHPLLNCEPVFTFLPELEFIQFKPIGTSQNIFFNAISLYRLP